MLLRPEYVVIERSNMERKTAHQRLEIADLRGN